MKKIRIIMPIVFFCASVCSAQVSDNFSDGDYTADPTWTPSGADNWVVVNGQLRSNVAIANTSFYITTPSAKAVNAQWEFWVNLQFNTSSANYVDVFLTADQSNLQSAALNGYFVRIGGTPDEISLYKIVNGITTVLINGTDGVTNFSNNTLRIKVVRDAANTWTLQRNATGNFNYFLEGTATDNTFTTSSFFGIRVQQSTATFFNRHFFDDLYAGEIILDTEPPQVQQVNVLNQNQLLVVLNEPLLVSTAETVSNYSASHGIGNPATAQLQADQKSVQLTFSQPFQNGTTHQLTVSGVADLSGNAMTAANFPFLFFQSQPVALKDVILTELMADPSPQVGLPDAEFIELYNRSANPVNLAGWKFTDGSSTATLTTRLLLPGQYLIVTSNANAPLFTAFGNVLGASNFPTLNNAGEALMLRAPDSKLIDSINYALTWYRDEDKQQGGWTLELIDPNNTCSEEDNWTASEAPQGGTPGQVNSVNANKPDVTGPRLLAGFVQTPTTVVLTFNEKLDKQLAPADFSISPEVAIIGVKFTSSSLRQVLLTFAGTLAARQLYAITAAVRDCAGNMIQAEHRSVQIAVPEAAEPGDVVVNEVLFNPRPGGVDFVEVVNTSGKFINLKNWKLANFIEGVPTNVRTITAVDFILPPGAYCVFTSNGVAVKNDYPHAREEKFLLTTLPAMNDKSGSIAVLSNMDELFDYLVYDEDFHTPILKDKEGVSLERVSFTNPATNRANWKSASSAAGYATPGFINSNTRPEIAVSGDEVKVDPEIFSPDRLGQDFSKIHYHFERSGWVANIKIADAHGRVVKEIANNETLGIAGFFRWDGDQQDGSRARMGYYFVWFEVFQLDGQVRTFRKRVVVAK
ncbi:MAG: lamin tail domain-containing protein [Cytophagales bacterium]|nr:lamin tail domain-containing protein [Cytophagales bacterium]